MDSEITFDKNDNSKDKNEENLSHEVQISAADETLTNGIKSIIDIIQSLQNENKDNNVFLSKVGYLLVNILMRVESWIITVDSNYEIGSFSEFLKKGAVQSVKSNEKQELSNGRPEDN